MERLTRYVGTPAVKKDARALVTGKPVYTDDIAPKDCLIVKVVRSPHAHALITGIDLEKAVAVPGIETILTWQDVPQKRFTMAGQTYPEPSPYDRLILDRQIRFVGDAVAIVAGDTEAAVNQAMKLVKVSYQVLEPVLDFRTAKDHPVLIHPEDSWKSMCPVGADNHRNLCATASDEHGDVDGIMQACEYVIDRTYHTKANQQAMMETFQTFTTLDAYGRLNITSSTQVPFHVRRILAHALDIPKSQVRVIKPRIGGGFGAKQTVVSEVYPAIVTWKTGKPAKMIFTRYESQIHPPLAMRWKYGSGWVLIKMAFYRQWMCIPCPIPVHLVNMDRLPWACPVINQYLYTRLPGLSALPMMWFIPTRWRPELTVVMGQPRESLPLSRR